MALVDRNFCIFVDVNGVFRGAVGGQKLRFTAPLKAFRPACMFAKLNQLIDLKL